MFKENYRDEIAINLSILDFKSAVLKNKSKVQFAINLSILDFK